jgi:glycosyltransferase involved in cell wall biosynthesis
LKLLGVEIQIINIFPASVYSIRAAARTGNLMAQIATRVQPIIPWQDLLIDQHKKSSFRELNEALEWADRVIIQKQVPPNEWLSLLEMRVKGRIIYDFDDAIWLYNKQFSRMLEVADLVIAGNEYLAQHARHNHSRVVVLPTGVNIQKYNAVCSSRSTRKTNEIVIGWVGSPSSVEYLELLNEPLNALSSNTAFQLWIIGSGGNRLPQFRSIKVVSYPKIPYDPANYVPKFDIGVMPLFDTPFTRGKCGSKILDYMAAKVASVCSPVGENSQIVQNEVNGLWARSKDEWIGALTRLIQDQSLRFHLGTNGFTTAQENYSIEKIAGKLFNLLEAM